MNPMIKYRGGKSRELSSFLRYIPKKFDTYYEPFLGGGAVYFYLEPKKAVINDLNNSLMSFYLAVRNHYKQLKEELDSLQIQYERNQIAYDKLKRQNPDIRIQNENEDLYYFIRDMFNSKRPKRYLDGALYFFINKTAYSGMIRYNGNGEFNVPFGRYPNLNTALVTAGHHELLKRTVLLNGDYSILFNHATEQDFMFLDPPYDCIFNDYGNVDMMNGFGEEQHRKLAVDFRNLRCRALMIIGRTPLTEELYGDYIVDEYYKNYSVNIRNRFHSEAKHIVVANYQIQQEVPLLFEQEA